MHERFINCLDEHQAFFLFAKCLEIRGDPIICMKVVMRLRCKRFSPHVTKDSQFYLQEDTFTVRYMAYSL